MLRVQPFLATSHLTTFIAYCKNIYFSTVKYSLPVSLVLKLEVLNERGTPKLGTLLYQSTEETKLTMQL